jgi:hypothetical protein
VSTQEREGIVEAIASEHDLSEQSVALLRDLADRLNERAAAEAASGRVNPRDAARVQDAAASVRAFTDRVAATRGDPRALERDYEVMVDKLVDARAVLARFTMNTQGDYGNLWNLRSRSTTWRRRPPWAGIRTSRGRPTAGGKGLGFGSVHRT